MLILLNGPPASGKSTLARRWVEDHPLALNLDLDVLWPLLGHWQDDLHATGTTARELALAMVEVQLRADRGVIVPQFLARPEFIDELAAVGGSRFRHVVLLPPFEVVRDRFSSRTAHPVAEAGLQHFDGPDELRLMYDRLVDLTASRPEVELLELTGDETAEQAYQRLAANEW